MKKMLSMLLVVLLLSMAACGTKKAAEGSGMKKETQQQNTVAPVAPSGQQEPNDLSNTLTGADTVDSDLDVDDTSSENDAALNDVQSI